MDGTNIRSSNSLDLKNPYFRYTGTQAPIPAGTNTVSPTDLYWNMASSTASGVNAATENGLDGACGGIMGNGLVVNTVGAYNGGIWLSIISRRGRALGLHTPLPWDEAFFVVAFKICFPHQSVAPFHPCNCWSFHNCFWHADCKDFLWFNPSELCMKVAGVTLVAIKCPVDTVFFLQGCNGGRDSQITQIFYESHIYW